MLGRCQNLTDQAFRDYGGRGIRVCERWLAFENFYADMGPRPSPKHSIDRIDNDGNYEPGNVRWATVKQQARNTRCSRIVRFGGRTMSLAEAAELAGLNISTVRGRFSRGWSMEEALEAPARPITLRSRAA